MSDSRSIGWHRPLRQPATTLCALLLAAALSGLIAPASAHAQFPPDSFTNLKVLPADIQPRVLVQMMAGFTRALGVRCTYCHVGEETIPLDQYDFASDEKLAKRKARTMIEMVGRINGTYLASLEERVSPALEVQCITCHRGARQPRMLQDVITQAWEAGGADSAIATYRSLRQRFYGRMVYDFGEVPLADVAGTVAGQGRLADAERLHELNVEVNPSSSFAQLQFVNVALTRTFIEEGPDAGRARHAALKARFGGTALPEQLLNTLGYTLLRRQLLPAAVAAFELNAEAWPESANVHDSLGEAYAASGDVERAIRSYERSLELDPQNQNAIAKLRELRGRAGGP